MNIAVANYDRLGWFVVLFALLLSLVAGLWRSRSRGLFASLVMFGALALALIAAALTAAHIPTFLFGTFDARNAQADDSWKAAQTIVLTLGFIGLVVTGVLGYHRQRTSQEQLALERRSRQHERYAKGSEMLASDIPEMRIAGLNVIATLGSEVAVDDELRQTCINLICAYLRKNSPADQGGILSSRRSSRSQRAEQVRDLARYRVVTEEACRLLPALLPRVLLLRRWSLTARTGRRRVDDLSLDLDLRGVNLVNLYLNDRIIGTAQFDKARFSGFAGFRGVLFTRTSVFADATFTEGAQFDGARFGYDALFNGATFAKDVWFSETTFTAHVNFLGATFADGAYFDGASFVAEETWFLGATFSGAARFGGAKFSGNTWFAGSWFVKYPGPEAEDLAAAVFMASVPFADAVFGPERVGARAEDADEDEDPAPPRNQGIAGPPPT